MNNNRKRLNYTIDNFVILCNKLQILLQISVPNLSSGYAYTDLAQFLQFDVSYVNRSCLISAANLLLGYVKFCSVFTGNLPV